MSKLTLVLITKNLPPDIGGMETMWFNAVKELAELTNLHVIAPQKCQPFVEQYCTFHTTPNSFPLFLLSATAKAVKLARKAMNNTYLLAGSGTTLLPVAVAGWCSKATSTTYLHGLDIIYPNWAYQAMFKALSSNIRAFFANSENTVKLAVNAGIESKRIFKVLPAANTWQKPASVQEPYKLPNETLNIVYFGRIIQRKGLLEFLQKALPLIIREQPRTHLHIIGEDAKSDHNPYLTRVIETCHTPEFRDKVTLWGKLPERALTEVVSQCDVNIFPLNEVPGDVEGFGIVVLEAASLGVSTVAFNCGGVADAITLAGFGKLIPAGEYDRFSRAVLEAKEQKHSQALHPHSWADFSRNIVQGLQTLP